MEARVPSALALVAALVATAVVSMGSSHAHDFEVGGRQGWVQNPSESYNRWAEKNRFQVNDRLVFRYKEEEDSVLVVNEPHYRACNTSDPIIRLHGGDSVFQFSRSGPFYFISGVPERCRRGEKLIVVVMSPRGGPTPSAVPSPAPSSGLSPPPKGTSSGSSSLGAPFGTAAAAAMALAGATFLFT